MNGKVRRLLIAVSIVLYAVFGLYWLGVATAEIFHAYDPKVNPYMICYTFIGCFSTIALLILGYALYRTARWINKG